MLHISIYTFSRDRGPSSSTIMIVFGIIKVGNDVKNVNSNIRSQDDDDDDDDWDN
jgi:hypothetical protein